ncbi:nucleoside deaminase [Oscillatoriales cyanobacterium LEGE 11467]|uniref:Nucleoside deaminase n=2 Tax=Zarconia TaxID=2992130 RepID=A0A928VZQ0_9CYAN|nr:nucleoside deaminase [Zarconia navalis LEGE 11467]
MANRQFMEEAIAQSLLGVRSQKGGPFGAAIVKNGELIAKAHNRVTSTNDPTAHAEILAIRQACQVLQTFELKGCELYTSCEPCPMCLGAIYWARLDRIYYANTKTDAAGIGFDDGFIDDELKLPRCDRQLPMIQMMPEVAARAFEEWVRLPNKVEY